MPATIPRWSMSCSSMRRAFPDSFMAPQNTSVRQPTCGMWDLQGVGDLGVRPGWGVCSLVSLQEDASMAELARRGAAACDQALQHVSILGAQEHGVVPLPGHG